MKQLLSGFADVAPYLGNPLILAGFVIFVYFSLIGVLAKLKVLSSEQTKRGLRYGFVLVLVVVVLAFAVFYLVDKESAPSVEDIVAQLEERHRSELEKYKEREQVLLDQTDALTRAVEALEARVGQPDAPDGLERARKELAEGRTEAARALFSEVATELEARGKQSFAEAAAAQRHLGALSFLDNTQAALGAYRKATKLDPADLEGWRQVGHLLRRIGDLAGAEDAYQQVLNQSKSPDLAEWRGSALSNLGSIYRDQGDLDKAQTMHEQALEACQVSQSKACEAEAQGSLGIVHSMRGDKEGAEVAYRNAVNLYEELGDKKGMAKQYGNLGISLLNEDNPEEAEGMFKRALGLNSTLGRKEGMARQYGNLGLIALKRQQLDEAEAMFNEALAIDTELGRKQGMLNQNGNLGEVAFLRSDLEQAEFFYSKALALSRELGSKLHEAGCLTNLGNVHRERAEFQRAEARWLTARRLYTEVGNEEMVAKVQAKLDALPE